MTPSSASYVVSTVSPNVDTGEDNKLLPSPRAETEELSRTYHGINSDYLPPSKAKVMPSILLLVFDVEPSQVKLD